MRVLIVEDEPVMAEAIRDGLRLEAIAADIAGDGDNRAGTAGRSTPTTSPSLDRDIPRPSGDEIASRIVASGSGMPIIMLTAADRLDDNATGLGLAPTTTSPSHLNSKSSCCVSEHSTADAPTTGHPCERSPPPSGCTFRREVHRDGRYVALTRKQFAVLEVLVGAKAESSAPKRS